VAPSFLLLFRQLISTQFEKKTILPNLSTYVWSENYCTEHKHMCILVVRIIVLEKTDVSN